MAVTHDRESTAFFGDRLHRLRDFLLSSRRFQRWAAAFPLTRPIARRRAADLFDLCAGFVYSQVLFACVELRLFQHLRTGPLSVGELAARASVPADAMVTLLDAAASLDLLERRGGQRYGLGPLGAAMLGNAGIAAMVEHHRALYADLADPVALLRGETSERQLARYWPYASAANQVTADSASPYTALMAASQPMVTELVLAAYSFAKHRCLLDIGGGDGSFLIAAGRSAPNLKLQLFDLPAVAEIACGKLAAAGVESRATVTGGHFLNDPLPRGADVVSLVRVVHDHDDDVVLGLLGRIHGILPRDGRLLIAEPMSEANGRDSVSAYFGVYLHAMGSGKPRSFAALRSLLKTVGFSEIREHRTHVPMIANVLVAKP